MSIFVKQFLTGGDRNFGYLAADEKSKEAFIVDPSYSPKVIWDFAVANDYRVKYIFSTHNHFDHTEGNIEIEKLSGIKPLLYGSKEPSTAQKVEDNSEFPLGGLFLKIIHTPGHTNDSICILFGDALFTGDTLFVGKVGGTDFGEGAKLEYDSLHKKLMPLTDTTRVFPGHNYGAAMESTIKKEKESNPFLIQPDFDSFLALKKNWLEYKKKHNIL